MFKELSYDELNVVYCSLNQYGNECKELAKKFVPDTRLLKYAKSYMKEAVLAENLRQAIIDELLTRPETFGYEDK